MISQNLKKNGKEEKKWKTKNKQRLMRRPHESIQLIFSPPDLPQLPLLPSSILESATASLNQNVRLFLH